MKNYYEILEVNKYASNEIISKVYKILAKKYHPDMNKEHQKEAEEKFKEISEAYDILSNEDKRKNYDIELEEYEKQLLENSNNANSVPIEKFLQLQEYCEKLEHSIAQLVSSSENNNFVQPSALEDDDLENLSTEELQARLDAIKYEEKQARKARRIELFKNIIAMIIMILFILWLLKYNGGLTSIL